MPQLRKRVRFPYFYYLGVGFALVLFFYLAMIPVRLTTVKARVPMPQAIFVLGGGSDREMSAARLAQWYPDLDVWISTGSEPEAIATLFETAGIPLSRVRLDYRAVDTVTNFTTMVDTFKRLEVEHVYLVTSAFHMRRARTIAFFVFGSRGIAYTPVEVASEAEEPGWKAWRDGVRSLLWLIARTASAI